VNTRRFALCVLFLAAARTEKMMSNLARRAAGLSHKLQGRRDAGTSFDFAND
jgi:hypothetical protein